MSIEERYTRIRIESGLPGQFIIRYLKSGYHENTYVKMEEGRVRPERIDGRLCEMLHVNPAFLERGEEPVFLDDKRVMDSDEVIRERILTFDPAQKIPEKMTIGFLVKLAEKYNTGWEYLVCGDEDCKDHPVDERMMADLGMDESIRKQIWKQMGKEVPRALYGAIQAGNDQMETQEDRINLLLNSCGMTKDELIQNTGLSYQFFYQWEKGSRKTRDLSVQLLAEGLQISTEWIKTGILESCFYPCGYEMRLFLMKHQELREEIWMQLYGERRLSWAKKFHRIRIELNWSGAQMIEYMDIGYSEQIYSEIEKGRLQPDPYLLKHLGEAFYINPAYLYHNQEPVLLNDRRVRKSKKEILQHANTSRLLFSEIEQIAAETNQSVEWLLCQDEMTKEYPFNLKMEEQLWRHEEVRRWIWEQMGYNLKYEHMSGEYSTVGERILAIKEACRLSYTDFINTTGISSFILKNLQDGLQEVSRLLAYKVAIATHVGVDWILTGDENRMRYPVDIH